VINAMDACYFVHGHQQYRSTPGTPLSEARRPSNAALTCLAKRLKRERRQIIAGHGVWSAQRLNGIAPIAKSCTKSARCATLP
jgi:ferredoxin